MITIDSIHQRYELQLVSIGFAKVRFEKDQALLKFRLFFFSKTIIFDPFKISRPKKKKVKKKKKSIGWTKMQHKAKGLLKSFKLEKLWLNIDTDNYYYNAFLYPIFFFIKGKNYRININYQGENELILILKNRPIRILFALIF